MAKNSLRYSLIFVFNFIVIITICITFRKARIRETFRKFDPNDVGFVSNEDAQLILGSLMGFSYERCRKTIELYDKNGDGKIDYEEFLEFYSMMEEE